MEAELQTYLEMKLFYKNYNIHDEEERMYLNYRKFPTIYFAPKYCNNIAVQLMRNLSVDPDSKYLTYGCQQQFFPYPGGFLVYKPHHSL